MIVHRNGSFLHVIEGGEDDVRALYECICDDDRHQWVTLLKATTVEERDFSGAPLAFRDGSRAGVRRPAGTSVAGDPLADGEGPAHETLIQFQRANGRIGAAVEPMEEDDRTFLLRQSRENNECWAGPGCCWTSATCCPRKRRKPPATSAKKPLMSARPNAGRRCPSVITSLAK